MVLVAGVVLLVAGFVVYRLHGIFASHDVTSTPSGSVNDIVPFNPKHVVIEVFGPPGTVATITYLDVDAQPQRADNVAEGREYSFVAYDVAGYEFPRDSQPEEGKGAANARPISAAGRRGGGLERSANSGRADEFTSHAVRPRKSFNRCRNYLASAFLR